MVTTEIYICQSMSLAGLQEAGGEEERRGGSPGPSAAGSSLVEKARPASLQASTAPPRPMPHVLCALRKASPGGWPGALSLPGKEEGSLQYSLLPGICRALLISRTRVPHLTFSHTNQTFRLPVKVRQTVGLGLGLGSGLPSPAFGRTTQKSWEPGGRMQGLQVSWLPPSTHPAQPDSRA